MADQESTDTSTDVTTSTNEEPIEDGKSLEDSDVSFGDFEDEDEAQETETETEDTEPSDEEESSEDVDSEEESTETPEAELSDEDKRKAENKSRAEQRIQEKQARESQKQQQDQFLKKEQTEYVADTQDPIEIAVRQLQVDAYNNKTNANTDKLTNDYERALKDFPVLNDQSPAIQKEISDAVDAFSARFTTFDQYGKPVDVRGDLYTYLQSKADSIEKLTGLGATKQTKDKVREQSKTLQTPVRSPKQPKADAMIDAFDEEASK